MQVVAAAICCKINTVVVAEAHEAFRVLNVALGMLLSPQMEGWSELTVKIPQPDE